MNRKEFPSPYVERAEKSWAFAFMEDVEPS
jgi:hypothetical protein